MRGQSSEQCFATASLAAKMRTKQLGGVVGLDLAGDEYDYPNKRYVDCFRHAKNVHGLNTTVHAGEATTYGEVISAVNDMLVDRIGHGYSANQDAGTLKMLRDRQIHLEACPNSAKFEGVLDSLKSFKSYGLNFGLNTDDPTSYFGNTTMAAVEGLVKQSLGFSDADIMRAYENSLAAAFGPVEYLSAKPVFV